MRVRVANFAFSRSSLQAQLAAQMQAQAAAQQQAQAAAQAQLAALQPQLGQPGQQPLSTQQMQQMLLMQQMQQQQAAAQHQVPPFEALGAPLTRMRWHRRLRSRRLRRWSMSKCQWAH